MVEPRGQTPDDEHESFPPTDNDAAQPREADSDEHHEVEEGGIGNTVGTGTSIALGCIAGTILLVVLGLIYLLVVMMLG